MLTVILQVNELNWLCTFFTKRINEAIRVAIGKSQNPTKRWRSSTIHCISVDLLHNLRSMKFHICFLLHTALLAPGDSSDRWVVLGSDLLLRAKGRHLYLRLACDAAKRSVHGGGGATR